MKKTHFYTNFPLRAASILTKVAVRAFFLVGLFTACRPPLSEISHPFNSALRQLNGTQFDCLERKIGMRHHAARLSSSPEATYSGFCVDLSKSTLFRASSNTCGHYVLKRLGSFGYWNGTNLPRSAAISRPYQRGGINFLRKFEGETKNVFHFKSRMLY